MSTSKGENAHKYTNEPTGMRATRIILGGDENEKETQSQPNI